MIEIELTGPNDFKLHDRVQVSATATGTGESPSGTIVHIEQCLGWPVISIDYDTPTSDGRTGITLINPGLITKLK